MIRNTFHFGALATEFTCVIVGIIVVFSFWMGPLTKTVLPFEFDVDGPSTYPSPPVFVFLRPHARSLILFSFIPVRLL